MKYVILTTEESALLNKVMGSILTSPEVTFTSSEAVCEDCGEDPCGCKKEDPASPIEREGKNLMVEFGYVDN